MNVIEIWGDGGTASDNNNDSDSDIVIIWEIANDSDIVIEIDRKLHI